jgi:hypothetical protein
MTTFTVPAREQVSENNQIVFDNLQKALGFVPNLYAFIGNSKNGLERYNSGPIRKPIIPI